MQEDTRKPLEITAMKPSDLAAVLSNSFRRKVTEEQVLEIAKAGNLLAADGTINLIYYTAYLAEEVSIGSN